LTIQNIWSVSFARRAIIGLKLEELERLPTSFSDHLFHQTTFPDESTTVLEFSLSKQATAHSSYDSTESLEVKCHPPLILKKSTNWPIVMIGYIVLAFVAGTFEFWKPRLNPYR
jgi:hypothetical protein